MSALWLLPFAVCGTALVLVSPILLKLFRSCDLAEITPEWLESFSVVTYYPMEGLLAGEDFDFLSRQPGFDLSLRKKLRRERLHIFKQYLNRMVADFNRLHLAARVLIASGRVDRSDVVGRLVMLKLRFSLAVIQAQYSYLLCFVGFRFLGARAMLNYLERMSIELSSLSAPSAA